MRTIIRNNYTPKAGDYHERIIRDESRHKVWLFDCDGIYTDITKIHLAEEFGDSSDIGLTQKFITEQFKATDEKIEGVREEVGDLSERVDGVEENLNLEIENRMAADEDLQENIDQVASDLEELKNSPDVVDIVNTKADLDAYDTSHLSENDVIRVLNDETKDNASTYYRWENGAWSYIGMTGPYYTKSQTDTLLNNEATTRQTADEDLQQQIYVKPDIKVDSFVTVPEPGRHWLELDDNVSDNYVYVQGGIKDGNTIINVSDSIGMSEQIPTTNYVDGKLTTKQDTLTAGDNITIEDNVISATSEAVITELTEDDYNYDSDNDGVNDCVALWLLPQGFYHRENTVNYRATSNRTNDDLSLLNDSSMSFILVQDGQNVDTPMKAFTLLLGGGGVSLSPTGQTSYIGQIYRIDARASDGVTLRRYASDFLDNARIYDQNDWSGETNNRVLSARLGKQLHDALPNTINSTDWSALWQ